MTGSTSVTPAMLARAAASGAAGAAFSVTKHPVAARRIGLAIAAGVGAAATYLSATQGLPFADDQPETSDRADGSADADPLPLPAAIGLGAGTFVVGVVVSELGIKAQAGLERWGSRTVGNPRLVVGLASALTSLGIDLVEKRLGGVDA